MTRSSRVGGSLLAAILLLGPAVPAESQNALVRDAPIQPVVLAKRGHMIFGVGALYERNVVIPLLDARGDLETFGRLQISWAIADGLIISLEGDAYKVLNVDTLGMPLVTPDEGLADGESSGAGNVSADVTFKALGDADGFAFGGRLRFDIPSSNQAEGLGTNTTNVRMTLLGSYGGGPLRFTGDAGLAILEAPLENFEQNDVFAYSAQFLYDLGLPQRLRVRAGAYGRASTRQRVPVGTEDIGELMLGLDFRLGSWLVDFGGFAGYAGNSGDWGLAGGVALLIGDEEE
ncbi:MAG: hypothetical protein GWN99_14785 [Gemmatimonadetes bacterium]|uniref:Transporter n=1 Tax=Candidatus Kutchimonas denitrificans TaxID=3056748 RepID=A0AAE5CDQ7_9BACT|nr:hypothetical protein [Gemmatimonadota bacterium]NIR76289.1 hypothetical protein [Candidatus Kutchimonas denitrificans]NIS02312.1 hypothetical protein [Gemmatimonadota bacterium]NIT68131.1 hypothetical protein [Gemmatimonadota bacterium]NIU54355.1 hypothetical protein [Gemmatimonadota bacterium]